MAKKDDFHYEITEHLENLSDINKGWVKQLNKVKWGDSEEKLYDIRSWHYPEGSDTPDRMSKGISLKYEEFALLCQCGVDNGIAG